MMRLILLSTVAVTVACAEPSSSKAPSSPSATSVGWAVQRIVDPLSDSVRWEAIAVDSGFGAFLVVHCQRDTLSAEILFKDDLEFGDTILTRIDSLPVERGGFERRQAKVARWRLPTRDLLTSLSGATKLVAGRQDFMRRRYSETYTILVAGADSALAPLRDACANAVDHRTPPPSPARRAMNINDSVRFLVGKGELPFIGSRSDKVAYSAFCEIWKKIPTEDRKLFVSRASASASGYKTADPLTCRAV